MNTAYFFIHIILVLSFLFVAIKMGKKALFVFISLMAVFANLFVIKQMDIFYLTVTCSDVYAVGALLGMNMLQEFYGKNQAKKAMYISFFSMIFYCFMTKMHLLYVPSIYDDTHIHYESIFSSAPRIIIASFVVFFIVQQIDILLYGKMKNFFKSRFLGSRVSVSLLFSQLLDTVLFTFLGLYGMIKSPFNVIVMSYCIKVLIIIFSSFFVSVFSNFIKRKDEYEKA